MSKKLLKCPFCGRKPALARGRKDKDGEWLWTPAIGCYPCKIHRSFGSVEDALAWWNKRKGGV